MYEEKERSKLWAEDLEWGASNRSTPTLAMSWCSPVEVQLYFNHLMLVRGCMQKYLDSILCTYSSEMCFAYAIQFVKIL